MALTNFFVPDAALIPGQRLIEGRAYSSKYGTYVGSITNKHHGIIIAMKITFHW